MMATGVKVSVPWRNGVRSMYSRPTAQYIMCRRISMVRLIEAGFNVRCLPAAGHVPLSRVGDDIAGENASISDRWPLFASIRALGTDRRVRADRR